MASLTNTKIKDTYDGLLKTTDNAALGGTYKLITDGLGNSSGVYLGTGGNVGIGQSSPTTYKLDVNGTFRAVSTAYFESGINAASYIFHQGDTNTFFGFPANDTFTITTNNVERMRIKSNGYVGIGEIDPSKPLTIKKDQSETAILVQSADDGLSGIYLGGITDSIKGGLILDNSDDSIQLRGYDNATRLFVKSDGNVGINYTNPQQKLEVSGASRFSRTGSESTQYMEFLPISGGNILKAVGQSKSLIFDNTSSTTNEIHFRQGGSNKMIIKSGNVGIGTNDPDYKLEVNGTLGLTGYIFHVDDSNSYFGFASNDTIIAATAGSERMRISSSGHLYVGTQNFPSASQIGFAFQKVTNGIVLNNSINLTTSTNHIKFYNPNGLVGSISTSGSSTSYNTSSDYRLKENVVDMTGALNRIEQLEPKRFNFISDAETTVDGFIAHEVQSVIPEAITGEKDAVDDEGNPQYQGIDQSKIVPLLVGAIKELKAEIETLKSQINS